MMDNHRTRNELFLRAVANEYSIDYRKLKMGVSDVFTREQQEDIDPDGDYLHSTKHFDCFVKEHEIKEVNVGTVVLYLKVVESAVSNSDLSCDLEDASSDLEDANIKVILIKEALFATGLALAGLSILF